MLPGGRGRGPATTGQLVVTTTRLRPGYLRKNGIPYGANAAITEYFVQLADEGQEYLAVTIMVDDPQYLALPYIKTYQYKKQPDATGWARRRASPDSRRRLVVEAAFRRPGRLKPAPRPSPKPEGSEVPIRSMHPLSGEYPLTQLERVVFGAGSVARLGDELERLGASRAVVVTGRTLGASPLLAHVTGALGARCVQVFAGARQHVPAAAVAEPRAMRSTPHRADCVVSFGGGSPIDAAKAAVHRQLEASGPRPAVGCRTSRCRRRSRRGSSPRSRASPTTARGSSTPSSIRGSPRVSWCSTRSLTVATPPWLWAASGMRAVDHAVETLYSTYQHPVSASQAATALARWQRTWCRRSTPPRRSSDRLTCQTAAWMSVQGIAYAGLGLSHALGHQIGPRWNVAHGVTSCITLPHAMRAIAGKRPDRFEAIAGALRHPVRRRTSRGGGAGVRRRGRGARGASRSAVAAVGGGGAAPSSESVAAVVHDVMSHAPRRPCRHVRRHRDAAERRLLIAVATPGLATIRKSRRSRFRRLRLRERPRPCLAFD